jgi:hypothetical protein
MWLWGSVLHLDCGEFCSQESQEKPPAVRHLPGARTRCSARPPEIACPPMVQAKSPGRKAGHNLHLGLNPQSPNRARILQPDCIWADVRSDCACLASHRRIHKSGRRSSTRRATISSVIPSTRMFIAVAIGAISKERKLRDIGWACQGESCFGYCKPGLQ